MTEQPEKVYPWVSHGEWKSRILDVEPHVTTHYFYNQYTEQQFLHEVWDIKAGIESNRAAYAQTDERASWNIPNEKLGNHIAWLPGPIAHLLMQKSNNLKDRKAVNRFLKDPANRDLIRRPIRLGV